MEREGGSKSSGLDLDRGSQLRDRPHNFNFDLTLSILRPLSNHYALYEAWCVQSDFRGHRTKRFCDLGHLVAHFNPRIGLEAGRSRKASLPRPSTTNIPIAIFIAEPNTSCNTDGEKNRLRTSITVEHSNPYGYEMCPTTQTSPSTYNAPSTPVRTSARMQYHRKSMAHTNWIEVMTTRLMAMNFWQLTSANGQKLIVTTFNKRSCYDTHTTPRFWTS